MVNHCETLCFFFFLFFCQKLNGIKSCSLLTVFCAERSAENHMKPILEQSESSSMDSRALSILSNEYTCSSRHTD